MDHPLSQELNVAVQAVRVAARICRAVQSRITDTAMEKQDRSPVTVADFASQAVICKHLHDAFPDDPVIAEEDSAELRTADNAEFLNRVRDEIAAAYSDVTSDTVCHWIDGGGAKDYSDRFWTLDPIDGTKGFLRKGQYAISLALIVEGRISAAVLGCPNLPTEDGALVGTVFHAVAGGGAFSVPLDAPEAEPKSIAVSATSDPALARLCESVESGHSNQDASSVIARSLGIATEPVRLDSQAKYAVVARGEADIYLRLPTRADYRERIWDHAGGVLVVEEAGGKVTDVTGRPLEFTHGDRLAVNRGVIVTNGGLHDRVLEAVRDAGVE